MNIAQIDPVFSEALRAKLRETVEGSVVIPSRRHRRLWFGTGVFVGTCLLGGAAALATGLLPLPGGQAVTQLAEPITQIHTGTATVELGPVPSGATNVSLTLACLSAGRFYFPGGANTICSRRDAGRAGVTLASIPLSPGQDSVTIRAAPGDRWRLTAQYVNQVTTPWEVNSNGQTYGVENGRGTPDLISAIATNGRVGYVKRTQLNVADGTTAAKRFTSPAQALKWQKARAGKTFHIPVYKSNGTTVIGHFDIGGGLSTRKSAKG
jgi:hypothetical protein